MSNGKACPIGTLNENSPIFIGTVSTRYSPIANLILLALERSLAEPEISPLTISLGSLTSTLKPSTHPSIICILTNCFSVGLSIKSPDCLGEKFPSTPAGITPILWFPDP